VLETLYEDGVQVLSGVNFSQRLKDHLLEKSNYERTLAEDYPGELERDRYEIAITDPSLCAAIREALPPGFREEVKNFEDVFAAVWCEEGFALPPHRDFYDVPDALNKSLIAIIILYLCPYEFEGREFVYGKIKTRSTESMVDWSWDDPDLETVGTITPKTGTGVIISPINPEWWHGVRRMESGGPVIAVSMTLY